MASKHFKTTSSRWSALQTRDPAAASSFIYSVISTRIYCRPSCPSRLARRANIIFHDTASEAEAAGFRPCKRCRPELSAENIGTESSLLMVEKAKMLIGKEGEPGEKAKWSVKELAEEVGLTESHFCRTFKRRVGMTVGTYRSHTQSQSTRDTFLVQRKEDDIFSSVSTNHQVACQNHSSQFRVLVEQPSQCWNICNEFSTPELLSFGKDLGLSSYIESPLDSTSFLEVTASQDNDDCFQFLNLDYLA